MQECQGGLDGGPEERHGEDHQGAEQVHKVKNTQHHHQTVMNKNYKYDFVTLFRRQSNQILLKNYLLAEKEYIRLQ